MIIDNVLLLEFFKKMYLIREFETQLLHLAERGLIFGSIHLCIGEEAAAAGTCMNLKKEDFIIPTHRGHGQEIVKGSDLKKLFSEMLGKETGLCKGRVGSMHITDKSVNNLGATGIIGANFPISVGVGLALKLKKINSIVVNFFGDGATNQGTLYESFNFADLWNLPIFFVCINNFYGMGTHYDKTCNIEIHKKANLFNISSTVIDGNDVVEVYLKAHEYVKMIREKKRPALIELRTYRWLGHSAFDKHPYRKKEEIEKWKKLDPIKRLEDRLLKDGIPKSKIESLKKEIDSQILEAADFALNSKYPEFKDIIEE